MKEQKQGVKLFRASQKQWQNNGDKAMKENGDDRKIITITIPNSLLSALDQAASREDRTRSNMICRLLKYSLTDTMEDDDND